MGNSKLKREVIRYFFMVVACACYAVGLDMFLIPHNIIGGGIAGAATLINILSGISVGVLSIALNTPILLMGLKTQGAKFILRCFITTTILGIFTDAFAFLPSITDNPLLAAMYGGVAQGIGIGIFVKYSVSSGGTELLGRIIHHKVSAIGIPTLIAILDGMVVIAGAIVLRNPENVLYALILIFISTRISDTIITGLNRAKLCYIITDHPDEVSKRLLHNSPRGVTNIAGTGMYTHAPRGVLLTCVKSHQLEQTKRLVSEVDKDAFVIVSETTEVRGKGFETAENE